MLVYKPSFSFTFGEPSAFRRRTAERFKSRQALTSGQTRCASISIFLAAAQESGNGASVETKRASKKPSQKPSTAKSKTASVSKSSSKAAALETPTPTQTQNSFPSCQLLPRVLLIHTGGTLGMDPKESFEDEQGEAHLREGTGGKYSKGLKGGKMLADLLHEVPQLGAFARIEIQIAFNKDSSRVGPTDWIRLAKLLDKNREEFDAFVVVHGTDTMAYTASALSLMLRGFRKPIILTGSQLPLASPRSDARQNLIDSLTIATASSRAPHVACNEVAVCFGGQLLRGNRAQKTNANTYYAFSSPSYPPLAQLGIEPEWNLRVMLQNTQESPGPYTPRFKMNPNVIRIPIVPGSDPRVGYGDLYERGVRGVVLEAFGLGNMPDLPSAGWMPWLRAQKKQGLQIYLASQCTQGDLEPSLYRSGSLALEMGVQSGPKMTPECAVCKMMLCLEYPDIPFTQPLCGEL